MKHYLQWLLIMLVIVATSACRSISRSADRDDRAEALPHEQEQSHGRLAVSPRENPRPIAPASVPSKAAPSGST